MVRKFVKLSNFCDKLKVKYVASKEKFPDCPEPVNALAANVSVASKS